MNGTMWLDVTHHQLITKAILYWLDSFFGWINKNIRLWFVDGLMIIACLSKNVINLKTAVSVWAEKHLEFGLITFRLHFCILPAIFCLLIVSNRNHFSNYTLVFKICKIINWIYIIHLGRLLVWFYCFQSSCYFPNPINCVFGYLWMWLSLNF